MYDSFFIGFPREFKNICLVYPPKVKEVIGEKHFAIYARLLTMSAEELEDEYVKKGLSAQEFLTPFEFLLNNCYHDKNFTEMVKKAFFFFIHEPITFLFSEKAIIIGEITELTVNTLRVLKEEDYFDFQNLVRAALGESAVDPPDPNLHPKIREMRAKARYRDQIKRKQGGGLTLATTLAVICCMKIGLTPLNIGELSYAAIPAIMEVYQNQEKYNLDMQSLLAGADSKKVKPEYWIKNLEK